MVPMILMVYMGADLSTQDTHTRMSQNLISDAERSGMMEEAEKGTNVPKPIITNTIIHL